MVQVNEQGRLRVDDANAGVGGGARAVGEGVATDAAGRHGKAQPQPAEIGAELRAALGVERSALWSLPRDGYRPAFEVVRDVSGPVAAVLTSARPATAATKIVDLWWRDDAALAAAEGLVRGVVDGARARGDVAVKWQVAPGAEVPDIVTILQFAELRQPWDALGTETTRGFVRWLVEEPAIEPGYYAQTTLFTCGAVAALIAADGLGVDGFTGADDDRGLEIGFWRRASNYPACEPIGLAVALDERLAAAKTGTASVGDQSGARRGARVEVSLDAAGPTLLEGLTGFDLEFRAELQAMSLREAEARGIPVHRDRIAVDEIVRRVAGGEFALLLIDEAPMHGEVGPHWIVAHGVVGGHLLVQDPWVNVEAGETWVDTHVLPVAPVDVDRLVRWGADGYRGVIFAH